MTTRELNPRPPNVKRTLKPKGSSSETWQNAFQSLKLINPRFMRYFTYTLHMLPLFKLAQSFNLGFSFILFFTPEALTV